MTILLPPAVGIVMLVDFPRSEKILCWSAIWKDLQRVPVLQRIFPTSPSFAIGFNDRPHVLKIISRVLESRCEDTHRAMRRISNCCSILDGFDKACLLR